MIKYTPVSGIYIILNTKNGNVYVGKATDLRSRFREHKYALNGNYHPNRHLLAAWNKYGEKAFKFLVLEYCSKDKLIEREKHHIAIYKERGLAYNLTDGGEGSLGRVLSEETRHKISLANTGRRMPPRSEEFRLKMSIAHKGKVVSEETGRKISQSKRGKKIKPCTEDRKRKVGQAHKGMKHTEVAKRRMSEAAKNRSEETKHKLSEAAKRRPPISDEVRRKMSEAQKRRYKNKNNPDDAA